MIRPILRSVLALTALVAVPLGAAAQNREHQQLAAELRILQEQSQQLALALARLQSGLDAINATIGDGNTAVARRFADLEQVIKGIAGDLNVMRVRTDETNTLIRSLKDEIEALRTTLVQLPSMLGPPAPVDPNDPASISAVPPPVITPPPTLGLSPNRMYDTAFGDYAQGQFTLAISGFEQLIKTFPTTERADDAQFFIGESNYALNRWNEAIAAYNAVIKNYPKSDQVPMAVYKRGLSYERLGQMDLARASYEQAIKEYPDSQGARLATQGLMRVTQSAGRP